MVAGASARTTVTRVQWPQVCGRRQLELAGQGVMTAHVDGHGYLRCVCELPTVRSCRCRGECRGAHRVDGEQGPAAVASNL